MASARAVFPHECKTTHIVAAGLRRVRQEGRPNSSKNTSTASTKAKTALSKSDSPKNGESNEEPTQADGKATTKPKVQEAAKAKPAPKTDVKAKASTAAPAKDAKPAPGDIPAPADVGAVPAMPPRHRQDWRVEF